MEAGQATARPDAQDEELRDADHRGRQQRTAGPVRNRGGHARWSSRPPGVSIKASFPPRDAQTSGAETARVTDRPRPASEKRAPKRPPPGSAGGPRAASPARGVDPGWATEARRRPRSGGENAAAGEPPRRGAQRVRGGRSPGTPAPPPPRHRGAPGPQLTIFAAAVAERGEGAGEHQVCEASSSQQPR